MKEFLLGTVILFTSVISTGAAAKGKFIVSVVSLDSHHYGVMLKNTYSDYYNEHVAGRFSSAKQAYDAGTAAREKLLASGVHNEPEHCWYDVDWL